MQKIRARTIEDVIDLMTSIVNQSITTGNRLGYFCALYRLVTVVVKQKCDEGFFADNDRMRELDTYFANRYFDALAAYKRREKPTESWRVAFDATQNADMMILQHLLMGMNAHINLDLGIATAEVSGGVLTPSLRQDFDALNDILTELSERVQQNMVRVSPLFKRFEPLYKHFDDLFVRVGISSARSGAWAFAAELVSLSYEAWEMRIAQKDDQVAALGRAICSPKANLIPLVRLVAAQETKDIHGIVGVLGEATNHTPMLFDRKAVQEMARKRGITLDND